MIWSGLDPRKCDNRMTNSETSVCLNPRVMWRLNDTLEPVDSRETRAQGWTVYPWLLYTIPGTLLSPFMYHLRTWILHELLTIRDNIDIIRTTNNTFILIEVKRPTPLTSGLSNSFYRFHFSDYLSPRPDTWTQRD